MAEVVFVLYLLIGNLVPMGEVDGRETYGIRSEAIDHAYKEEVIEWIETGKFEYNEDL